MRLTRSVLPAGVTVVAVPDARRLLLNSSLTRNQAFLAITGLLPHVHADTVDHWLDQQYERETPITSRRRLSAFGAVGMIALSAVGVTTVTHTTQHRHHTTVVSAASASARRRSLAA